MQKFWKAAACGGCVLLGIAIFFSLFQKSNPPQPPEPSYQGKTLSEWMCPSGKPVPWDQMAFEDAIHHIGTNAIPCLLNWMQYQEPGWKAWVRSPFINSSDRSREAALARATGKVFEALGPDASCAIGDLTRLMNDTNTPADTAWRATWAISYLGSEALPELMNALTNPPGQLRNMAAIVIPHLDTNAYPAVPLLIACLSDKTEVVVTDSELALGKLKLEPEIAIPALTAKLNDPSAAIRKWAAEAIGMFGGTAKSAIPSLEKSLNDPDVGVRTTATNALGACTSPN